MDMEKISDAKYYVLSDGNSPSRILFSKQDIMIGAPAAYIDSFDENGQLLDSYKYDYEKEAYVTDF